jgi:hypothetical protein
MRVQRTFDHEWDSPPFEFSLAPFWFWNDTLTEREIVRQMDDFRAHRVHAFVIHSRVGLPRSLGWMSDRLIALMRYAIEQAAAREMWVMLYDEGMYPSGSSSGQVVATDPAFQCRGLACVDLDAPDAKALRPERVEGCSDPRSSPALDSGQNLVAVVRRKRDGHRIAVIDRAIDAVIRGLHYVEDDPPRRPDGSDPPEDTPPAADLLNPRAVQCFVRLVYERYYREFGAFFGETVRAIFTDEPMLLGRPRERGLVAGTTGILEHVNDYLGYDFTPHLPALWYGEEPDAGLYRRDYHRAIQARLEETYYRPLFEWCERHGIALTGHPAEPDAIGQLRYFHIPGQDIVWRYVEPDKPSALEGPQSTQAKCASSAMVHLGRCRNANEFCGAYGHSFTFEEMQWLAYWLLVRGCNLLIPHAFYYSVRGPRVDERPPDVGPNSPWWDRFPTFADACRRLCWLNADSRHVCQIAILGASDSLPWRAARVCLEYQRDFNYLEARHLWEDAEVSADGIRIAGPHHAGMHYRALIVEDEPPERARPALDMLERAGRLARWDPLMDPAQWIGGIDRLVPPDVSVSPPSPGLRVRHVVKGGVHCYMLFNEGGDDLEIGLGLSVSGERVTLDPLTGARRQWDSDGRLRLERHQCQVLMVHPEGAAAAAGPL